VGCGVGAAGVAKVQRPGAGQAGGEEDVAHSGFGVVVWVWAWWVWIRGLVVWRYGGFRRVVVVVKGSEVCCRCACVVLCVVSCELAR
jgi:hypothetical protein